MKKLYSVIIIIIFLAGIACSDIGDPENPVTPMTDTDAVAADLAALEVIYGSGDSAGNVTQNVTLPTGGSNGSAITWVTTDSGSVTIGGVVMRPVFAAGNASVTLTATISKGSSNDQKEFTLTVIALPAGSYQVTFDSQGATVSANPSSKLVIAPATTVETLPTAPARTEYAFVGWFTETDGGGTAFTGSTTVSGNITVYAKWLAKPVVTVGTPTNNTTPTWSWTIDASADSYKYKLDTGSWVTANAAVNPLFTPDTALATGSHTLEVQQEINGVWSESGIGTVEIVLNVTAPSISFTSIDYTDVTPEWTWDGPVTVTDFRYRMITCDYSSSEWAKPATLPDWVEVANSVKSFTASAVTLQTNYSDPAGRVVVMEVQQKIDSVWSVSAESVVYILEADIGSGNLHVYAGSSKYYRKDASTTAQLFDLMASAGAKYYFLIAGADDSGTVWGTWLYTNDSRIARAAIHAGKITSGGSGTVKLKFSHGASGYTGSTANGITTVDYGSWPGSYIFLD